MARAAHAGRRATVLFLAAVVLAAGPAAAKQRPTGVVGARGSGPIHALVELNAEPTAITYATQSKLLGRATADSAAVSQLARVQAEQTAFRAQVALARLPHTREVYALQRVFNGVLYVTDAKGFAALRAMPGVKAVHLVSPMVPDNAHAVPLVGAIQLWSNTTALHGEGIRVGVIDTGIDYTHANFGGPGTVSAYTGNNKNTDRGGHLPHGQGRRRLGLRGRRPTTPRAPLPPSPPRTQSPRRRRPRLARRRHDRRLRCDRRRRDLRRSLQRDPRPDHPRHRPRRGPGRVAVRPQGVRRRRRLHLPGLPGHRVGARPERRRQT